MFLRINVNPYSFRWSPSLLAHFPWLIYIYLTFIPLHFTLTLPFISSPTVYVSGMSSLPSHGMITHSSNFISLRVHEKCANLPTAGSKACNVSSLAGWWYPSRICPERCQEKWQRFCGSSSDHRNCYWGMERSLSVKFIRKELQFKDRFNMYRILCL